MVNDSADNRSIKARFRDCVSVVQGLASLLDNLAERQFRAPAASGIEAHSPDPLPGGRDAQNRVRSLPQIVRQPLGATQAERMPISALSRSLP